MSYNQQDVESFRYIPTGPDGLPVTAVAPKK